MFHSVSEPAEKLAGKRDVDPFGTLEVEFNATEAVPGSREKIHVMAQRAKCGQPLWHPEDRNWVDPLP